MHDVLSLILGGGRGARLYPLTKTRSEPAVPIAGKYRLIDIPISNCLNSGLNRIYVLTQYLSASLHSHLAYTYKFDPFSRGFVEILAAQQTNETADWYQGTADAVRQNRPYIEQERCRDVLVLSGDQLYRFDFRRLLDEHRAGGADVTMAVTPVARAHASRLGVLQLDAHNRLTGLIEKPQTDAELVPFRVAGAGGRDFLANMGIYLFSREALLRMLDAEPTAHDFVREIFARNLARYHVRAYRFDGYWEDLGTIQSYYEANLALAGESPPFDFHTPEGVVFTRSRNLPAAQVSDASLDHCLVSDGCVIAPGARIERAVLGIRSRVGPDVTIRDSILLGADRYETEAERAANRQKGQPDYGVGAGTVLERTILDKDCRVGRNVRLVNRRRVQNEEHELYVIRDGIVVVPNGTLIPDGFEV